MSTPHSPEVLPPSLRALDTTLGDLAHELGISPYDVLENVASAGVSVFWNEGTQFRSTDALQRYLARAHRYDPVGDVEVELTASQLEHLAQTWDVSPESWARLSRSASPGDFPDSVSGSGKPLRKFVASDPKLPDAGADRRKEQSG